MIPAAPAWRTPLDQRQVGRNRWMLLASLVFDSARVGLIVVPAEFIYNGASVPRVPVAYWLTGGRAWGPACLHDALYQHPDWEDRALADYVFWEAMGAHQPDLGHEAEPAWVRAAMWGGARAGGWWAWRRHRARAAQLNPVWTGTANWPALQIQAP